MKRTEEQLRAAFTLAAEDAPSTDDVLARVAAARRPKSAPARGPLVRRWAPIAAIAAIVIAIAVPIGFVVSSSDSGNRASSSSAADAKAAAPAAGGLAASSAAAGIANPAPEYVAPSGAASGGGARTCTPSQLALTLTWTSTDRGLIGALKATNTTSAACDLAVKPSIYPLSSNGKRLPVLNAVSAEGYAGPARLLPGASATSSLSWSSWCGAKAGNRAEIDWNTGLTAVTVSGPTTPACVSGGATNISSNWFAPLS